MLLITGASGRIGRRAAEWVAAQGVPLRLMTRTPAKAPRLPGVDVVAGDFGEPASLVPAFDGVDRALVISGMAVPGVRAEHHRHAFLAAVAAGVEHVVYLSLMGAGFASRFSYSRDHATSEAYLAVSGIPAFTVLRSAFYFGMLPEFIDATGTLHDPSGNGRAAFVSREDTARVAAAMLLDPPGGTHDVTGPEAMSVAEAVARLAKLTGRPLRHARGAVTLDASLPTWRHELYTGWFAAIAAGELARVTDTVKRFTGREALTLEACFKASPQALAPSDS